jgi:hypothetical protein
MMADRLTFWAWLDPRLARPASRLGPEDQAKIREAIEPATARTDTDLWAAYRDVTAALANSWQDRASPSRTQGQGLRSRQRRRRRSQGRGNQDAERAATGNK